MPSRLACWQATNPSLADDHVTMRRHKRKRHPIATRSLLLLGRNEINTVTSDMGFTEDLVQIVRLVGHEIDRTTDLELRDGQGELVTMKNVVMNEDKLRRIRTFRPDQ